MRPVNIDIDLSKLPPSVLSRYGVEAELRQAQAYAEAILTVMEAFRSAGAAIRDFVAQHILHRPASAG